MQRGRINIIEKNQLKFIKTWTFYMLTDDDVHCWNEWFNLTSCGILITLQNVDEKKTLSQSLRNF